MSVEHFLRWLLFSLLLPALAALAMVKWAVDAPEAPRFATADLSALMLAIPVEAARADKAAVMDAYERRVGEYVAAGYLVFDADAIAAGTATPIPIDMPELVALQSQAAQAQAQAQEAAADAPTAPAGISILSDQYLQDLQR